MYVCVPCRSWDGSMNGCLIWWNELAGLGFVEWAGWGMRVGCDVIPEAEVMMMRFV